MGAAKITGMFMNGMATANLSDLLSSRKYLKQKIEEAMDVMMYHASLQVKWVDLLDIGDIVDARCDYSWCEGVIRDISVRNGRKLLHIHFIGKPKSSDDAIFADDHDFLGSQGLQRGTLTHQGHIAR